MSPSSRPKLIIAEDNPEVARYFVGFLSDHFDLIAVVADGQGLVKQVKEQNPDCVLADVGLIGMNGIAATQEIRRHNEEIPIVLMTAAADPILQVEAVARGASAFMSKTEAARTVIAVLQNLLNRRKGI